MPDRISVGHLFPGTMQPGVTTPKRQQTTSSNITNTAASKSFREMLQQQVNKGEVRFSQHAEARLQQRGINLQPEQLEKIGTAIDKAAAKGSKDSLLLMNDLALIVNIKNRTVVTAMDESSMKDNVFTQIDSAVIVS